MYRLLSASIVFLVALLLSVGLAAADGPATDGDDVSVVNVQPLLPDGQPHLTANVRVGDVLGDGSPQVIIAEPLRGQVVWMRALDDPVELSAGLVQPVRTHVVDLDQDGHRDILVADIGSIIPTDEKPGRVVLLRNDGSNAFDTIVLLENVGRVACAEAADLDGDGDLDIAVCVFGHNDGEVIWLEQQPGFVFETHLLDPRPGAIHAFPFDADGDGDLDIAVSMSQTSEEVVLFRRDELGQYNMEVLFSAGVDFYGMSGIELVDLDRDGDTDILVTNGDEGDGPLTGMDPYTVHGLAWLENDGLGQFAYHDILRHWGAYAAKAVDGDSDGDLDIVLTSLQGHGKYPPEITFRHVVWLENDGAQGFTARTVDDALTLIVSIDVLDADGDGKPEIVGGTFNECRMADLFLQSKRFVQFHVCEVTGHRLAMFNILTGNDSLPNVPSASAFGLAVLAAILAFATWRASGRVRAGV